MKELLEQLIETQNNLDELNWRKAAGGALLAASLLGVPNIAQAARPVKVTQAEAQIDINKLLDAIKQVESSGGKDTRTRHEPGVEKQLIKRYDVLNPNTASAIDKYGYSAIATSYGPYQMLASTAFDLGYEGTLEDLKKEEVSRELAKKYTQKLIKSSRTKKVEDVISAYNAGLGRIGTNPGYIDKVIKYYGVAK
jgi:hypothetical protein